MEPRDLNAELPPVARLGQCDVADVEFDVEFRVFDPIGIIEIERHAHQPLPETPRATEATLDEAQDILEADEPAGGGGRIIDPDRADMHRGMRCLKIDERRVLPAEL